MPTAQGLSGFATLANYRGRKSLPVPVGGVALARNCPFYKENIGVIAGVIAPEGNITYES